MSTKNNSSFISVFNYPGISTLLVLLSAIALLYIGKPLFIPLLFAFFVAIFLLPLSMLLERWHCPRPLAAGLSVTIFIAVISIILFLLGQELGQFLKTWPALKEKLGSMFGQLQELLQQKFHIAVNTQTSYIKNSAESLMASAGAAFAGFFGFLIMLVLFIFFTFYILSYRAILLKFIISFYGDVYKRKVTDVFKQLRLMVNDYIKGLIFEMVIVFISGFILLLIFGLKYALLMAVLAALLNIIPYLGMYTAIVINTMIALATGNSVHALEVCLIFVVVHLLDANVLLPKIVGKQVKINPFMTLVVVVAGELLWGIPGMFLAIPATAVFRIVSEKIRSLHSWSILLGQEK